MKTTTKMGSLWATVFMLCSASLYGQTCGTSNYEPNNSISQTAPLNLYYPMDAAITPNDVDYYYVTVPTFGSLSITLAGYTGDLDLQLLTTAGSVYATSAQTTSSYESINWHVPGGPNYYIVKVFAKNPATANTCYQLYATFNSGICSPNGSYEPNETSTTARTVYPNNEIKDNIGSATDVDWYQFTANNANTRYRIYLNNPEADYDMELYTTGTGGPIASSSFYGAGNEYITFHNYGYATYKIRVSPKTPGAYNLTCYALRIQESYEPNNFRSESGTEVDVESISTPGALFPNPATSNETVYVHAAGSATTMDIQLMGASGNVISSFTVPVVANKGSITLPTIQSGVYFIKSDYGIQKLMVK